MIRLLFETFTFEVQKDEVKMPEFLNIRLTRSLVGPLDPDMNNHVPLTLQTIQTQHTLM